MKKIVVVVLIIVGIVALFLSLAKDDQTKTVKKSATPVDIEPNKFQDAFCKMKITDKNYACEVISAEGITWFFDDIGCMIKWLYNKKFASPPSLWVYALDSKKFIDAKKAYYSQGEKTPMGYGFGAYEKREKDMIDFEELKKKILSN